MIYDHAADVGYPALPMDVSVAKAFIGSIEYVRHHLSSTVNNWNTKIYFNDVTHQMDDTNRPEVPIRMDMPGWSETAGFYSELKGGREKNSWRTNLSGHWNSSLAEMTMFSNNSGERDMFMLTWPGVHTYYVDVFGEHTWQISNKLSATITGGLAAHQHHVKSEFGFESIQIFYPNVEKRKSRLLKRASSSMEYQIDDWLFSAELAYGERAPSVSEGYGFYLFNSFDQYDYIGNPHLSNEQSFSGQMGISYSISDFTAKLSASNFYIMNYILGRPKVGLSEMTIGAAGVKVYEQLSYANIINSALDMQYRFNEKLLWSGGVSYRRGKGKEVKYLPLIQPFSYQSELAYYQKSLSAKVGITGAAKHQHYNPEFGEQAVADYWTMNISVANLFRFGSQTWLLNAGIENVLDRQYTTFADWNRLPRMGRNLFVNLVYYF